MTQDPFDRLRDANPMPEDRLPAAPMSTASAIVSGNSRGRPWPGWAIAAAAALTVIVTGGAWLVLIGGDPGGDSAAGGSNPSTTTPLTTTSPSIATAVTSTSVAPADTTAPITTTVPGIAGDDGAFPIYLFLADNGTEMTPGPFLVPAMRTTAVLSAPATDLLTTAAAFLVAGPTPGEIESIPALSSAIPAGTEVLGVDVAEGVATIDLSATFTTGGGSLSMRGRLAQVVYTLTAFDDVDAVRFEIEGAPTTVFGGEGVLIEDPATRAEFDDLLPAVFIDTPHYWGQAGNPLIVDGSANVFEATVSLALTDGDGLILWEGFTTATCGTGCRGDFEVTIPYDIDRAQLGAIIAWEVSARDGSQTNVREHPVWLVPADASTTTVPDSHRALWRRIQELRAEVRLLGGDIDADADRAAETANPKEAEALTAANRARRAEQEILRAELEEAVDEALALGWPYESILDETCSGARSGSDLLDRGVEPPVLETWSSLHQAAVTCDWAALRRLAGEDLQFSFGLPGDPIGAWLHEEALGDEPLYHLAEILTRPHAVSDPGNGDLFHVWPSAFPVIWEDVPEADREALRPLYGDADFAGFAEFGAYIGYRVGIDADTGEWLFFIQGD